MAVLMKQQCRNILIISLLCLAALPVCFSVYFQINQACIQYEMMEELEKEQMETILLSKKDIHWIEKDKELMIDGHLFDVKTIAILDNNQVRVEGLFDEKEDQLYATMRQSLRNSKTGRASSLFPLLYFQFLFEKVNIHEGPAVQMSLTGNQRYYYTNEFIAAMHYPVIAPPPRL